MYVVEKMPLPIFQRMCGLCQDKYFIWCATIMFKLITFKFVFLNGLFAYNHTLDPSVNQTSHTDTCTVVLT
jgi:hypothetical protein